jgi:O-antigen/teichoic acid export membrane protein
MGMGIFMIPFYTRILTPKDYGFIELLTIFGMVVSVFLNLEIYQAVARFYPEAPSADDKKKIVSTSFWFIVASFALQRWYFSSSQAIGRRSADPETPDI